MSTNFRLSRQTRFSSAQFKILRSFPAKTFVNTQKKSQSQYGHPVAGGRYVQELVSYSARQGHRTSNYYPFLYILPAFFGTFKHFRIMLVYQMLFISIYKC